MCVIVGFLPARRLQLHPRRKGDERRCYEAVHDRQMAWKIGPLRKFAMHGALKSCSEIVRYGATAGLLRKSTQTDACGAYRMLTPVGCVNTMRASRQTRACAPGQPVIVSPKMTTADIALSLR